MNTIHSWGRALAGCITLILVTSCASNPPEFGNVRYSGCDDQQIQKLTWSLAYMRAAAKSSSFRSCLKSAVEGSYGPGTAIWGGGTYLHTFQESNHVGYYRPCAVSSGPYREPEFVYQETPFQYQNRLLAYEAALAIAQSEASDILELSCTDSPSYTAQTPAGSDHGYFRLQHDSPYRFTNRVHLGRRMFTQFPDHQDEDYGEADRFGTLTPAYPIDEIAGILLHEILHNYGFEHGTSDDNECGYPEGYETGRFRSLNEIAEACMSEVAEGSMGLCLEACADSSSVPIVTNPRAITDVSLPHSCQCTPFK